MAAMESADQQLEDTMKLISRILSSVQSKDNPRNLPLSTEFFHHLS